MNFDINLTGFNHLLQIFVDRTVNLTASRAEEIHVFLQSRRVADRIVHAVFRQNKTAGVSSVARLVVFDGQLGGMALLVIVPKHKTGNGKTDNRDNRNDNDSDYRLSAAIARCLRLLCFLFGLLLLFSGQLFRLL